MLLPPFRVPSSHGIRCQIQSRNSLAVPRASAPLWDLSIPPAQCARLDSTKKAYLCELPDLPSLPNCTLNNYLPIRAKDHRSGSATSHQAHCSSNLLEPRFQVTRCSVRSPTGMHGQNLASITVGRFAPSLPDADFIRSRINAPVHVRAKLATAGELYDDGGADPEE